MSDNPFRLPRTVVPTRYELVLEPDLERASFHGRVSITVDVREATSSIVLNANELTLHTATIDGDPLTIASDLARERATLSARTTVQPGTHTIDIVFDGTLNDKLRGWYRSTFVDAEGATKVIATTQMQATDCRRAFPCWDEPDFKAVFSTTLVVDPALVAVSNGPEISRERRDDGKDLVRFADTMAMSTYLVAFVVGPLEVSEPVDVDGVPLRIVHLPGKANLAAFAKEIGAFSLRWFQDYYGIAYPSDKVDLLALPDFAAGAMENLGCITFRENVLLVDPATATQRDRQLVADVVAHEMAHLWFGDLVTMRWWNGIWLNEAFATFMEVAACDAFEPQWQRWTTFSLERTAAFETDSLRTTRPVEFEVLSPADADGMFDVLTYEKGGALLRMLEQYLGPERFRDGIREYLHTHRYGNTETSDLWDAIEKVTGEPVRRIMDSWIWQGGYPLVSARIDGDELVLTQDRFLFDDDGTDLTRWAIPVHVAQQAGGAARLEKALLDGDELRVPLLGHDAAVRVNAGGHGFYRVAYSPELLGRLTGDALAELTTIERYTLVDDAWAAVMAGRLTAADFCQFAKGFADETEVQIWQNLLAALSWCDRFLEGSHRASFQVFVRELVGPALERLTWQPQPDEADLVGELRALLVRNLAVLGNDPDARAKARALHDQHLADGHAVHPPLAAAAMSVVAATGDVDDYEVFLQRVRTVTTPQESLRYLFALAEFPSGDLLDRTLALAMSGEVKTQNAPFLLRQCIANRNLGARAWRFVREHWAQANAGFPDNTIVRMIDSVKTLTRSEEQADVAAFFGEHAIPQAAKTLAQVLERQQVNVTLRQRASEALETTFA